MGWISKRRREIHGTPIVVKDKKLYVKLGEWLGAVYLAGGLYPQKDERVHFCKRDFVVNCKGGLSPHQIDVSVREDTPNPHPDLPNAIAIRHYKGRDFLGRSKTFFEVIPSR